MANKQELADARVLLEVEGLQKFFYLRKRRFRGTPTVVKAVDGVSFTMREGEFLGIVGESGSGKTTLGLSVLRAHAPTAGKIMLHLPEQSYDLAQLSGEELRPLRKEMQMIFQDPFSSLNPRMSILDIVSEPLRLNGINTGVEEAVRDMLVQVGLSPEIMLRYPHAFSGGQRQRIAIARALILNPRIIVADECTSALDVSVQAQILKLLEGLRRSHNVSFLFISHNLAVIEYLCDRVLVMYLGRLVETADTEVLFQTPKHPYTAALLAAVPKPDPRVRSDDKAIYDGDIPDPANPPPGCAFHPRCPHAKEICMKVVPSLREVSPGHEVSCHFADDIILEGVKIAN